MEENKEYWDKVKQRFYKSVKETNWGLDEVRVCKRRGRKAKPIIIAEQVLRPKKEYKRVQQTKFFNFH